MNVNNETRRWLNYAERDINAANFLLPKCSQFGAQICFLSQQGAEKSLKALLIYEQIEFPFRHDLDRLRNLLPEESQTYQIHADLAELTQWAVEARYPSPVEEPTAEDAMRALQQAKSILLSVKSDLQQRGLDF